MFLALRFTGHGWDEGLKETIFMHFRDPMSFFLHVSISHFLEFRTQSLCVFGNRKEFKSPFVFDVFLRNTLAVSRLDTPGRLREGQVYSPMKTFCETKNY